MASVVDTPSAHNVTVPYIAEIDGMRSVAVLLVVVFHLKKGWLPGGFVGVDIFFVISGYLITTLIVNDMRAGSFNFRRFYQRRIARILPLFAIVALATWLAAWLVFSAQDFASTGSSLAVAALSVINMKLILQGSYFAISEDSQPLLHYWSLAVEEQFYLLYPFLLWLARPSRASRRLLIGVLAGLLMVSLLLSIAVGVRWPTWAFYLLPTRAWELLAGALISVVRSPEQRTTGRDFSPHLARAGVLALVLSVVAAPHFALGTAAVFGSVVGTAIILLAVTGSGFAGARRVLAHSVAVWIGKRSYSLYLWHWPVFSLVDYELYDKSEFYRFGAKTVLVAVLVVGSYDFIERPLRRILSAPKAMRLAFVSFAIMVLILVPLGRYSRGRYYVNVSDKDLAHGGVRLLDRTGPGPSVMLIGDSHAAMYAADLRDSLQPRGLPFSTLGASGKRILPASGPAQEDDAWISTLDAVNRARPDVLIYVLDWEAHAYGHRDEVVEAIELLRSMVSQLIVVGQPPVLPPTANREAIRGGSKPPFYEDETTRDRRLYANRSVAEIVSSAGSFVSVDDLFQSSDGSLVYRDHTGRFLYQDDNHLSNVGARLVVQRIVADIGG